MFSVETTTSSVSVPPRPSFTVRRTTNTPRRSGVKRGPIVPAPASAAVLPAGRDTKAQENASASPSTSVEPLPSSVTSTPTNAPGWSEPALATGSVLRSSVFTTTVSASLSSEPSLTTSSAT